MDRTRAQPVGRLVDVALPLPLSQRFSYRQQSGQEAELGAVVRVPFGPRHLFGVVCERHDRAGQSFQIRELQQLLPSPYVVPAAVRELCGWLAGYYGCSEGEALALALPPRPGTKARRSPVDAGELSAEAPMRLNAEQQAAFDAIHADLAEGRAQSSLLFGVTGSGKTEVYLQLMAEALRLGRSALMLLPEIALTPQTLRRIAARFPGAVAPYHSRLSVGERCAVWEGCARGEIRIVVGARSATLLPMQELGLIVIDEEHETSFKSDKRPRHHARDVALVRAQRASIPIVLGSATPSLESWANAQSGKHRLLKLSRRAVAVEMPKIQVLDRRGAQGIEKGGALSDPLVQAIEETLEAGNQAIVFHNRRGFARFVQCHGCGEVRQCADCDISMIYHLDDDRLHCHYCDAREAMRESCDKCEAKLLRPRGVGTQRVELALQARLPEARILRLDQDSARAKDAHAEILDRFGRGDADVLLGTQMVAKGLDFPRVRLVGVIDADAGLHFPDFRAQERAFQLLTQVSGRSGRREAGRVILQTFDPEHRVLRAVLEHDVEAFLRHELVERQALGYPPARRLAALSVSAPDEALLDRALQLLDRSLRPPLEAGGVQLLGPSRAAIGRIKRRHRGQLLLKGGLSAEAKRQVAARCEALRSELAGGGRVDFALDVDPLHLL